MSNFVPFNRDQTFLLPPDLRAWLPEDDLAHFMVAAVERVPLGAFIVPAPQRREAAVSPASDAGTADLLLCQWHLLVASDRAGHLSRHRRAFCCRQSAPRPRHDCGVPPHQYSRDEAAFLQVLLLARESGLLRLGTVSIDGTKIDANASKIRSVRYDRAQELRAKLAADIAALTAQAEAADAIDQDPQALPEELARREALKAKLDAACARLEAEARAEAEAARPEYDARKAAYDAKTGRRGRPPKPPEETPPPERQSNLTDPDSALMRRSDAHEYRQAYNAQAVVCADGSQLILATNLVPTSADAPSFAATVLGMKDTIGLPKTVLADTGFASVPPWRRCKPKRSSHWLPSAAPNRIGPTTSVHRPWPVRAAHHRPVAR